MVEKQINYSLTSYLFFCDVIEKYNLKNKYGTLQIKRVVVTLNLGRFAEISEKGLSEDKLYKQVVLFFFCLLVVSQKISWSSTNKLKENDKLQKLSVVLKEKKEIFSFIDLIFLEKKIPGCVPDIKIISTPSKLSLYLPVAFFGNFSRLFNFSLLQFKFFNLRVDFFFSNTGANSQNIKMLPHFWSFF